MLESLEQTVKRKKIDIIKNQLKTWNEIQANKAKKIGKKEPRSKELGDVGNKQQSGAHNTNTPVVTLNISGSNPPVTNQGLSEQMKK